MTFYNYCNIDCNLGALTCGINGQAGTFRKTLRSTYCRSWEGGQDRVWCRGMRTYPMSILRNGLIAGQQFCLRSYRKVVRFLLQVISKEKGFRPKSLFMW